MDLTYVFNDKPIHIDQDRTTVGGVDNPGLHKSFENLAADHKQMYAEREERKRKIAEIR